MNLLSVQITFPAARRTLASVRAFISVCFYNFQMHTFVYRSGLLGGWVIIGVHGIATAEMPAISVRPTVADTNADASTSTLRTIFTLLFTYF